MPRRWLITGCSTGLGRALAETLARSGEQVMATARQSKMLADLVAAFPDNVITADLDVRSPEQCTAAISAARERFGGIDVLVNNAGYGQFGVVEEISDEELAAQFETNFFGSWRLTRMVLPILRQQGSGHIFFVSSVVGSMAFPGLAAYTSSKFAQEGLAESLAQEVAHLGVKVTILQLGGFSTSYGNSMLEPGQTIADYAAPKGEMLGLMRALADNDTANPPALFARVVQRLVDIDGLPLRVPIGEDASMMLSGTMAIRQADFTRALADGLHK